MFRLLFVAFSLFVVIFFVYRTWNTYKQAGANIKESQEFLQQNGTEQGVITTESGLQYKVLNPGTGTTHPTMSNKVKVHYHGTLLNGTVFDSSVDRGTPITFGVNQVIKGWQEGLQTMVEGEKTRFYIPSDLAYGKSGSGPIPPGALLIFDVELLEIQ